MSWFETWFGTPYYNLLYRNRDDAEAQAFMDVLTAFLQLPAHSRVLDLACGAGRHSIYLATKGLHVWGCDIIPENITAASAHQSADLHFFQHDMRDPLPVTDFNAIFNLFTSFGYFETEAEEQQTMNNIAAALSSNGLIVIDFFNSWKVLQQMVPYTEKEIEGMLYRIKKHHDERFIYKDIEIMDHGTIHTFQEKVRLLKQDDFSNYFRVAGLEEIHRFGNYALEPFSPEHSDRLILIARKR